MTTMPFPTTTGISAAYDHGSAQVHQHLTAALGALGQMDANVHGAIDMLNSEIAALRAFLQQAANTPDVTAQQALQLLQLEDAVNQAQTQTTTPAQAATASTGLRDLFNRMFGRPANMPIVPAAPVASQPVQPAQAPAVDQTVHVQQPNPAQAAPQGQRLWFADSPDSLPGTTQWDRDMAWGMNDHDRRIGRVENDVQALQRSNGGNTALANALKFGGVAAIIMVIFTIIMEIVFWHHTLDVAAAMTLGLGALGFVVGMAVGAIIPSRNN